MHTPKAKSDPKPTHPVSKKRLTLRWIILVLAICSSFGVEFSFDNPAVLKELLYDNFKDNYDQSQFEISYSLIYSCLAIPNVIVPFIIGYLTDKLGVRSLYMVLAVFSVLGQSLVAVGISKLSFPIIYAGRMVLGMACESMACVQGIFLSQYFGKKHLSSIVGGIYCLANLGGVVNALFTPRIAISQGISSAFWTGAMFCFVTAFMTILACIMDLYIEKKSFVKKNLLAVNLLDDSTETFYTEIDIFKDTQRSIDFTDDNISEESLDDVDTHRSNLALLDFSGIPPLFWYICGGTFLIQASILSFDVMGADLIESKWYSDEDLIQGSQDSDAVFSMFRLSSCIFSPLLGYVVDKAGNRQTFFFIGTGLGLISHLMVISFRPLAPCVLFGIAFSLIYTVCWPMVMMIVPKTHVGKACGLITSLENIGLVIFPIVDSMLKNAFGSYDDSEIFLAAVASIGVLCGLKVYQSSKLNKEKVVPEMESDISMVKIHGFESPLDNRL